MLTKTARMETCNIYVKGRRLLLNGLNLKFSRVLVSHPDRRGLVLALALVLKICDFYSASYGSNHVGRRMEPAQTCSLACVCCTPYSVRPPPPPPPPPTTATGGAGRVPPFQRIQD